MVVLINTFGFVIVIVIVIRLINTILVLMGINAPKIAWVVIIFLYMCTALKDFSNGAEDEFQIFLHSYLTVIEKVLEKC